MNSNHCIHIFDRFNYRCVHCGLDKREFILFGNKYRPSRDYEEILDNELGLLFKGKDDEGISEEKIA